MTDTRSANIVPRRWEFSRVELPKSTPLPKPCQVFDRKIRMTLRPDGREEFLPELDPSRMYDVMIEGDCSYFRDVGIFWDDYRAGRADALYRTDDRGNFLEPHAWVWLDGRPLRQLYEKASPEIMAREDRATHVYRFRIQGTATKLAFRFDCHADSRVSDPRGVFAITVDVLPEGTPLPGAAARKALEESAAMRLKQEAEERAAAEKESRAREEARREHLAAAENAKRTERAKKERAKRTVLESKLESLQREANWDTHLLDPGFQAEFAKHNPERVLTALKPKWQYEYDQFMQDRPLRVIAEKKAPEVMRWFEARMHIVQLAERFDIRPTQEAVVKPTAMDERAKRLGKYTERFDEEIAFMQLRGDIFAKLKDAQNKLPQSLNEEEKQLLGGRVEKSILGQEDEEGRMENEETL